MIPHFLHGLHTNNVYLSELLWNLLCWGEFSIFFAILFLRYKNAIFISLFSDIYQNKIFHSICDDIKANIFGMDLIKNKYVEHGKVTPLPGMEQQNSSSSICT